MNGTVEGHLNVPLLYETLRRIINEAHPEVELTVTVRRKDEAPDECQQENTPIAV